MALCGEGTEAQLQAVTLRILKNSPSLFGMETLLKLGFVASVLKSLGTSRYDGSGLGFY